MGRACRRRMMERLAVVGMGYVGIPVATLFAHSGLDVVGLDVDKRKVDEINAGRYPIEGHEPGLPELIATNVGAGRLRATTDYDALADRDAVLVCVDTPFNEEAFEPRYDRLRSAAQGIGQRLRKGQLVVIESTIAPGTMDRVVRPVLEEASGLKAGEDFLLGNCPERVMPGKLLGNLRKYDRVMGGINQATHDAMRELYSRFVEGDLTPADMLTAEVVKTFENTYRDVEIALANEFARYCDQLGVDFHAVRALVNRVEDRNLHLPGTGVGGHCIPKDTYLLAYGTKGTFTPEMMLMARRINDAMPAYLAQRTIEQLRAVGRDPSQSKVAVLGLSYLGNSDDTRNTPSVPLVAKLREAGCEVQVHDPLAGPVGGVQPETDLDAVIDGADALVIATAHEDYRNLDLPATAAAMRTPVLVDGRHVFQRHAAETAGFRYLGVGN